MERQLTLVDEKRNILKRILDEHMKELKEFKDKMASVRQDESELKRIEDKWGTKAEKVRSDKS